MAEQLDEPFDPRIPQAFVCAKPVVRALERSRVNSAVVDSPADGAFHESCPLEGLDVLRGSGERDPIRRRELADRVLAFGESLEHGTAGPVAEGAEDEVEPRVMLFNHKVEYIRRPPIVNRLVERFGTLMMATPGVKCISREPHPITREF
jgi:hypothetical protein